MKHTWVTLFTVLSALVTFAAQAEAGCDRCNTMNEILQSNNVDRAARFMNDFHFSKDKDQIQSEAYTITLMAVKYIPKDKSGDIDEFYYSINQQNPEAMEFARSRLSPQEKKMLENSLKHTAKLRKSGNGQIDTKPLNVASTCPASAKPAHSANVSPSAIVSLSRAISSIPAALPASPDAARSTSAQASGTTTPLDIRSSAQKNSRGPASVAPSSYSPSYETDDSTPSQQ